MFTRILSAKMPNFYLAKILYRRIIPDNRFLKTALNVFYTTIFSLDTDVHVIPDVYLFGHSIIFTEFLIVYKLRNSDEDNLSNLIFFHCAMYVVT